MSTEVGVERRPVFGNAEGQDGARYLEIAVGLAANLPQLAEIRRTLRLRMAASPMMDRDAYVADLEAAYRAMWQTWCAGG